MRSCLSMRAFSHRSRVTIRTGISAELEKEGLFIVPLAKGLRVSVASISEEKCRKIPAMVKDAMDAMEKR